MTVLSNLRSHSIRSFVQRARCNTLHRDTNLYRYNSNWSIYTKRRRWSKYQIYTYSSSPSSSSSSSSSSQPVNELLEQICNIEERQRCRGVVDAILLDPRTKMTYNEYIELCKLNKLNVEDAKKLSEALHTTGIIWYFSSYFEEEKPLIIKTNEVCRAFLRSLDLDGIINGEFIDSKKEALKHYILEIKPLEEQHEEIELMARKYVRRCWRIFFSYVIAHCIMVPYLTFWKYSWDIMEPVTYMFNLWTLFMGTWFYMNSSSEFSNEGISQSLLRMRKEKLYQKYNFDIERYTFLQEKIAEIEDDLLNPEWMMLKSVHPQLPDYIKHIHLTPNELFKTYQTEENK